jgi:hypothetical protein
MMKAKWTVSATLAQLTDQPGSRNEDTTFGADKMLHSHVAGHPSSTSSSVDRCETTKAGRSNMNGSREV